jgi:hypothetical protein
VDFRQLGCTGEDETSRLAIGIVGSLPLSPRNQPRLELPRPALVQDVGDEARHDYAALGLRLEAFAHQETNTLAQPVDARSHRDDAVLEIDILPVQAEDFVAAQTESEGQIDQRLQRVALNLR